MVTVTLRCQHCQSTNLVRNGLAADGRQRYLCRDCQQRSREEPRTNAYSDEEREQILRAYDEREPSCADSPAPSASRVTPSRLGSKKGNGTARPLRDAGGSRVSGAGVR
jgi:predicted Fe-S protein YdhL (DUF1289 family)